VPQVAASTDTETTRPSPTRVEEQLTSSNGAEDRDAVHFCPGPHQLLHPVCLCQEPGCEANDEDMGHLSADTDALHISCAQRFQALYRGQCNYRRCCACASKAAGGSNSLLPAYCVFGLRARLPAQLIFKAVGSSDSILKAVEHEWRITLIPGGC